MSADPTRRGLLRAAGAVALLGPAAALPQAGATRALFGSRAAVHARDDTPAAAAWRDAAWRDLAAIDRRWNAWKPGEVTSLNRALREGRAAAVADDLAAMIRLSAWCETASLGCFRAGLGGLVADWGFHADVLRDGPRPEAATLARWRAAPPALASLEWRGGQVRGRDPRLQLDFGAIGKGVAIDRALDAAQAGGAGAVLVDLGGNLAAWSPPQGPGWRIGIRDPFGPGLVATVATRGREAVVTSGSYERHRIAGGVRATHILDPRTAAPAAELVGVTVFHPRAALADAAATALLVAGPSRWRGVAARMGVDQVLVIARDGRAQATPALRGRLAVAEGSGWRITAA